MDVKSYTSLAIQDTTKKYCMGLLTKLWQENEI